MQRVKLKDVCLNTGQYGSNSKAIPYDNTKPRYLRITDINDDGYLSNKKVSPSKIEKKYYLNKNDFLFARSGSVGLTYLHLKADEELEYAGYLIRFIPNLEKIFPKYLFYFTKSKGYFNWIKSNQRTVAQTNINAKQFSSLEIPLVILPQQKQIAQKLDKAKELIELRKESIKKLDELSKSVFIEMFGDPVENEMGWEVVKLESIMNFLTSGSRGWAKYYDEKGQIFIRIQNVKNGKINLNDIQYINAPSTKEAIRTRVEKNDLLLSITADLGRTGIVTEEIANSVAFISQHLALIRLKNIYVTSSFVSAFLETPQSKLQFIKLNKGGTKSGLNFDSIKSFKIFLPPLSLQQKFAKTIQKIEAQKALYEEQLVKLEYNFEALLGESFG